MQTSNPNHAPRYGLRRAVAAGSAVVALLGTGATVDHLLDRGDAQPEQPTEPYTVQHGDTGWDIAEERTPNSEDVRPLVDDIMEQAGDDGLQPGETITVPPTTKPQ